MRPYIFLTLLSAGIATAPVAAQDTPKDQHLDSLKLCKAIADPQQRLACYDGAVTTVLAAVDQGEIRVVDKADVEKTRRGLFGFTLPKIGLFGGNNDDGEVEQLDMLESTITEVRQVNGDTYLFRIAEGDAQWQISNAPMRFNAPKVGDKVVFKRASFSSYFIRVGSQIGVKGRRVN